jgi:hypothetical protein
MHEKASDDPSYHKAKYHTQIDDSLEKFVTDYHDRAGRSIPQEAFS